MKFHNIYTPWGQADQVVNISPDQQIIRVSTPGHGGFGVSKQLDMPSHLASAACSGSDRDWRWFEEDEAWACVVLAFPQHFKEPHFKPEIHEVARNTVLNYYPEIYEKEFGHKPTALESRKVRELTLEIDPFPRSANPFALGVG